MNIFTTVLLFILTISASITSVQAQQIFAVEGQLTFIRVHDVGTGFGSQSNFIDAEVIVGLNSQATNRYGFQLRNDTNQRVRQGMLDLLRDAFENNWNVRLEYFSEAGKTNFILFRVIVTK